MSKTKKARSHIKRLIVNCIHIPMNVILQLNTWRSLEGSLFVYILILILIAKVKIRELHVPVISFIAPLKS